MSTTVGKVVMGKVYAAIARQNCAALTGSIAPKKIEDVVRRLEEHFEKLGVELWQCDVCGGFSPQELPDGTAPDACPFCNTRDASTAAKDAPAAALATSDQSPPGRTLAAVEDELDAKARSFWEHMKGAARSFELAVATAVEIRDLHRAHALEGRLGEFAEARLGLSRSSFFELVRIGEKKLAPAAEKFGVKIAGLLAAAKDEDRPALLAKAEGGATKREMEAEARRLRGGAAASSTIALGIEPDDEVVRGADEKVSSLTKTFAMTKLGPEAAVHLLACMNGASVLLTVGRDDAGELVGRLRVVGGGR